MGFITKALILMRIFQSGAPEISAEQFIGLLYLLIPGTFGIITVLYFYMKPKPTPTWIGVKKEKPKEDDVELC